MLETDKVFAGSIPENYDRHMVPLIFEPYAADIARRAASLSPNAVLETAAGSGVVTRALAPRLPRGASYIVAMSASLIGRLGSSAFRPSAAAVSMSPAGSCFSSESAPGPFQYGIRERGGTIFGAALPSCGQQVQADIRTHLIHRPARDIIPPLGGARVSSYRV